MNGRMELIFDGGVDGCLGEKWRTTCYEVFVFSTAATNTWFVFLCAMFDFWIAVPMWPHSANSRLCYQRLISLHPCIPTLHPWATTATATTATATATLNINININIKLVNTEAQGILECVHSTIR